jgi:hypothetical protein
LENSLIIVYPVWRQLDGSGVGVAGQSKNSPGGIPAMLVALVFAFVFCTKTGSSFVGFFTGSSAGVAFGDRLFLNRKSAYIGLSRKVAVHAKKS